MAEKEIPAGADLTKLPTIGTYKQNHELAEAFQKAMEESPHVLVIQEKTRWIPCNERLPKVGIPVLIYDKHHKAFFVAKLDEDYFGFSSNMWHHPADVPFWMPLPEPPEGGADDGS